MSKLKEMIKEKRVKVLLLVILLIFLNYARGLKQTESPSLIFVSKNNKTSYEAVCVLDGTAKSSGLGWIFPIPTLKENLPNIDFQYVPSIKNEYSCDFFWKNDCTKNWQMKDWSRSQRFSLESFYPVLDERWEGFPTLLTSNLTKDFSPRMEIPQTFNLGISMRSDRYGEVALCEGWNPSNYPCYYLNIGGEDNKRVYLKKFKNLPQGYIDSNNSSAIFKDETAVISSDEWRSYSIVLNNEGKLEVNDLNKQRMLLTFNDSQPIKPIYLLLRSKQSALWKIHNDEFMYTTIPASVKFGPTLTLNTTDLCVSFFALMCSGCRFSFSVNYGNDRKFLKTIENDNNSKEWTEVRLLKSNIYGYKVELYVTTDYNRSINGKNLFWAISNVRVCSSDEIRVGKLSFNLNKSINVSNNEISCHLLNYPTWRPVQYELPPAEITFKNTSVQSTSIGLEWEYSLPSGMEHYQPFFLIHYKGKDICEDDLNSTYENTFRKKSRGYSISRRNEIFLKNLEPYTSYYIHVTDVVKEIEKRRNIKTLSTDIPTKGEIPSNVSMRVTDTTNIISWPKPNCFDIYGPLVYRLNIRNSTLDLLHTYDDSENYYRISNLEPYTHYILELITARKVEQLDSSNSSFLQRYNFSTLPGVAPNVTDLEVYYINKTSATLRYKLPKKTYGIPQHVKVTYCLPLDFTNCITKIENISSCSIWKNMSCITVKDLMPNTEFTFWVSIMNINTTRFGYAVSVSEITTDHVPGAPSNLTQEIIECNKHQDYCHMNVSWLHPFHQKGTISSFDIVLRETNSFKDHDETTTIHEIYKVPNEQYQYQYSYVIKYIPFNTQYNLSVRSMNERYKGEYTSVLIKTAHLSKHIDQTPILINITSKTLTFSVPEQDWRLNSRQILVFVQNYNKEQDVGELLKMWTSCEVELCNSYGKVWLADTKMMYNNKGKPITVTLTDTSAKDTLQANTSYCVTFLFMNKYKNEFFCTAYYERNVTTDALESDAPGTEKLQKSASISIILMIIFMLVAISVAGLLLYRHYQTRQHIRHHERLGENAYEQIPFEDHILEDSAYNPTYDKLIHNE